PDTVRIVVGKAKHIDAFPLDDKNAFIANKKVTWISSDPAIATVDDSGLVTGLTIGNTTIVAKVGDVQGDAPLFVSAAPSIGLSTDTATFQAIAQSGSTPSGSVGVTNIGGAILDSLALGTIDYGTG